MNPVTRQDVQNVVDVARSRMMERMVTRQDIAPLFESAKTANALQQQNQQLLKQLDTLVAQYAKLISALELRSSNLESEVKTLKLLLQRNTEQQRTMVMPAQSDVGPTALPTSGKFVSYA